MWGWKTISAVLIVGITLFGSSALLVKGQENSRAEVVAISDEAQVTDEVETNEDQSVPQLERETKFIEAFPSPIQGKPLREAGEYYSEELETTLFHAGTDFAQAEGAVIRVKYAGRVNYAGPDPFLGHKVELDCGDDWRAVYGGLKNLRVKEGDWVEVDQAIGQIGYYPDVYGDIEQTHLHYEVWHGDLVQVP